MRQTKTNIYFWGSIYSNWHTAEFEIDNIKFYSSEQAFMYKKAEYFKDLDIMERILKTKSPKEAKNLGRKVKNFDNKSWEKVREEIMFECVLSKFEQNPVLKIVMLNTGDKKFVEASPYDLIWGVGLSEDDPEIEDENNWKGLNLLGKILNKVRNKLRNDI